MPPAHYAVALDRTDASRHTLDWLFQRLVRSGDIVTLITVLPGWKPEEAKEHEHDEDEAKWTIQELLQNYEREYPDKSVESYYRIIKGTEDPRPAIVNTASEINATMLVLGSHGKSKGHRQMGHTINNYALDNSKVPVVVVRADRAD